MSKKYVSVPLDQVMYEKLRFIAANESRSVSKQVWYLIRCCIETHEKMNGPIAVQRHIVSDG